MEHCTYRCARLSDLLVLRSKLDAAAWNHVARLLEYACAKPEWILLCFEAGVLVDALILAAPSEFNLPLEIIRLSGGLNARNGFFRFFQWAIEKAKALGIRELYCTVPEESADGSLLSRAGFCRWRKVVRFESAGPVDLGVRGCRSAMVGDFTRTEIIALIDRTSERCADSQIEGSRRRLGGMVDAEMTLQMMESTRYEPRWWRVALAPEGESLGIIFLVVAFGQPTVGFVGIIPEHRGRNIASFLLTEAWSTMKRQGHSTLCAEADGRNVAMHRLLTKNAFTRRSEKQEWRLEL
jgi:GNAT superfamily N-acetyltransferase